MERQPIGSFYEKVKTLGSGRAQTGGSSLEARSSSQRTTGGKLPAMTKKSSGFFGGKRSKIKSLIEKYNATDNQQSKKKYLLKIRQLQVDWRVTVSRKAAKAKDGTIKFGPKLSEIDTLENDVLMEAQWLDDGGQLRAETEIIEEKVERKEEKIPEFASSTSLSLDPIEYRDEIVDFLVERGYKKSGQYYLKHHGDHDPHVGWKAHIGATLGSSFTVLNKVLPILDKHKFTHKVDSEPGVFDKTNKFITIYPPENEEQWAPLIEEIEGVLGHSAVIVPGELAVGTQGHVGMRHGQLTALTTDYLDHNGIAYHKVKVEEDGSVIYQLDNPTQYDNRIRGGIMVTQYDKPGLAMFVNDDGEKGKFCPAMLYNGKVYPDPRAKPNPFGFTLPKGVATLGKRT